MPGKIHILLIEDDHDDIDFLKDSLNENKINFSLETLTKGDQINTYLNRNVPLPDLIVMDLNLPKLHGREVLCQIREEKRFKNVPVVILTTSSLPEDRLFCMDKGADHFVSKPSSPDGFNRLIEFLLQTASKRRSKEAKFR